MLVDPVNPSHTGTVMVRVMLHLRRSQDGSFLQYVSHGSTQLKQLGHWHGVCHAAHARPCHTRTALLLEHRPPQLHARAVMARAQCSVRMFSPPRCALPAVMARPRAPSNASLLVQPGNSAGAYVAVHAQQCGRMRGSACPTGVVSICPPCGA